MATNPLRLNGPLTVVTPVPVISPPDQLSVPLMVRLPAPATVPPLWLRTPFALTVDGPFSVRVGDAMESVWVPLPPPRLRLFTVAATSSVTVKVVLDPFAPMTTSSPAAGSWAGLQFAALFQFPVPAFQLMVNAGASTGSENSDVLPFASVAVAVTLSRE